MLYLGTETGLFVSIDRAKSWMRIKANLPTVRIDEITLHPRDNAMILATHGRALWILDHLEPIQEYAAAQAATSDARLFTPPPFAMYRRPARDRNYEFWGDQTFYGENPPQAAVISWINKKQVGDVKLKITDATGRDIREISGSVLAKSNAAGLQTACWDLRVQPAPAPPPAPARGSAPSAGPDRPRRRLRHRARRRRRPRAKASRRPAARRAGAALSPKSRARSAPAARPPPGRAAAGVGGAAANLAGPFVIGGVYNVSLIVDGKTVDTKPLRVNDDPDVDADVGRAQADVRHGDGDPRACSRASPMRRRRTHR